MLSKQDSEWVKLVAREIAFEAIKETLSEHVQSCPHGQNIARFRAWMMGLGAGLGLVGMTSGYAIAKLIP